MTSGSVCTESTFVSEDRSFLTVLVSWCHLSLLSFPLAPSTSHCSHRLLALPCSSPHCALVLSTVSLVSFPLLALHSWPFVYSFNTLSSSVSLPWLLSCRPPCLFPGVSLVGPGRVPLSCLFLAVPGSVTLVLSHYCS